MILTGFLFKCIYCPAADIPIPIRGSIIHIPIESTSVRTIIPITA